MKNHHADDLVIFSPYSAGLQQLLKVYSQYRKDYDIKFNSKQSHAMIVRDREDRKLVFPVFQLCNIPVMTCTQIKCLGHFLTDRDIFFDGAINAMLRPICCCASLICVLSM